eukprot:gene25780-34363_t
MSMLKHSRHNMQRFVLGYGSIVQKNYHSSGNNVKISAFRLFSSSTEIGNGVLPKPSAVTLKADFSKRLKKAQQEALLGAPVIGLNDSGGAR